MRILIIIHPIVPRPVAYYNLPMGVLYVAAEIRKKHEVTILNLNEYTQEHYERIIKYRVADCDMVMISALSIFYNTVKALVDTIKKYKDVPVVLGGGLVTSQPEVIQQAIPNADVFVSGEIEAIDINNLSGIVYPNKKVLSKELDTLMPAYDLFNMELYLGLQRPSDGHYRCIMHNPRDAAVIASRGCPYKCTFCFHPTGDVYRQRSLDSVFHEIEMLKENYAINIISVYDELFARSPERLANFCNRIKPLNLYWSCQLRVDSVDENALRMMKDSGCYIISFGIESGSDTILRNYEKHITVKQIDAALAATKKVGIAVQGNILLGAEAETQETINESIEWWKKHKEYRLAITKVIPYPGTSMYARAVAAGKIEPITYLEHNCPEIDCTSMDNFDDAFKAGVDDAMKVDTGITSMYDIAYFGNTDTYGRVKLYFKTKCPHCGYVEDRYNYAMDDASGMYFCKSCFMRYGVIKGGANGTS